MILDAQTLPMRPWLWSFLQGLDAEPGHVPDKVILEDEVRLKHALRQGFQTCRV